jgi:tRNA modification GTPase
VRLDCQDTIAAVASPPGAGLRGIIRLSGPAAFELAAGVFRAGGARPLAAQAGWRRLTGRALVGESVWVPAEAYLFRAPASYTRQDMVELHLPGSPALLGVVLRRLLTAGARLAGPGEFTARAFLAGAMDLTAAEAVAATIAATSDEQLRAARALAEGRLARQVHRMQDALADLLALVEAQIDFADEPIQFIKPAHLAARVDALVGQLAEWQKQATWQERLDVLPKVMLIGPPNVGKSTLLNRLTGLDRAICSPLRGTTRDVLSAPLSLPVGEVELIDAAGLESSPAEGVELLAHQVASAAAGTADLLLLVADMQSCQPARKLAREFAGRPTIGLLNKTDLIPAECRQPTLERASQTVQLPLLAVSALTGEGLEALRVAIAQRLAVTRSHGEHRLALNSRHRAAIASARDALIRARPLVNSSISEEECATPELIAYELREAMEALAALTGEVPTEELLGRVFARFCIGK